jgi:transposase
VLWWHSGGFCLFSKRLEKGSFRLPSPQPEDTAAVTLEAVELTLLRIHSAEQCRGAAQM